MTCEVINFEVFDCGLSLESAVFEVIAINGLL